MSKRFSVKKAQYSKGSAEWYKKECEKILYQNKIELQIDGSKVYIIKRDNKNLLVQVTNLKTLWFEIWLKLSNR